jgi:type I restriction enzyme S subunit
MKKYQSYKPSGIEWIGEIPNHWRKRKFKWDIFYQEGPGLRTFQFTDEGIRVICVSNITEKGIDFETTHTRHISKLEYLEKYKHFTLQDEDILLSSSGSIGKVCKYFFDGEPVILNTSTIRIHTKNPMNYCGDFVKFVLISNYIQIQLKFLMTGGIVSNFGPSHLDQLINFIPPLQEQEQIVKYLDDKTTIIDKLISTKQRKVELLKEQRTTLINQVITKGLNPNVKMKDSGVEWIGEIPESWRFIKVGYISSLLTGNPWKSDLFDFKEGIKIVRGENVSEGFFRWGERTRFWSREIVKGETFFLKEGDIIVSMDGSKVGKNYIMIKENDLPLLLHQRMCRIRTSPNLIPEFLNYYIGSEMFRYYIDLSKTDPMIPHITQKDISNFSFSVPQIQEQQEIVEYLDTHTKEIDDLVSMEQKKIELLKEYRQSLISEVIMGKIKVID